MEEQKEETTKTEHEPPVDSPRFKKVYGEKKSLERENESLKQEMQKLQDGFSKQNEVLGKLESFTKNQEKQQNEQKFFGKVAEIESMFNKSWEEQDAEMRDKAKGLLYSEFEAKFKAEAEDLKKQNNESVKKQTAKVEPSKEDKLKDAFKLMHPWHGKNEELTQRADSAYEMYKEKGYSAEEAYNYAGRDAQDFFNVTRNPNNMESSAMVGQSDVTSSGDNTITDYKSNMTMDEKNMAYHMLSNFYNGDRDKCIDAWAKQELAKNN